MYNKQLTQQGALNYPSGLSDPASQATATTIADFTFIVNKNKTVASTAKHPARNPEALVYINKLTIAQSMNLQSPKVEALELKADYKIQFTADTASTQNAEKSIQTDRIAATYVTT